MLSKQINAYLNPQKLENTQLKAYLKSVKLAVYQTIRKYQYILEKSNKAEKTEKSNKAEIHLRRP